MNSPLTYWEQKILNWERARYSKWLWFYPLSWTIRSRLNSAIGVVKKRAKKEWRVIELGCGSGILASHIYSLVNTYTGVDIAANAIAVANERVKKNEVQFIADDVKNLSFDSYDLAIFLGLTDWLEKDQVQNLFDKLQVRQMLFSYTEKEIVSEMNPYFYYRKFMDRKSEDYAYRARSYSRLEIESMLKKSGYSFEILKSASLINPGVLVWAQK